MFLVGIWHLKGLWRKEQESDVEPKCHGSATLIYYIRCCGPGSPRTRQINNRIKLCLEQGEPERKRIHWFQYSALRIWILERPDVFTKKNALGESCLVNSCMQCCGSEKFIPDLDFSIWKSTGSWIRFRNTACMASWADLQFNAYRMPYIVSYRILPYLPSCILTRLGNIFLYLDQWYLIVGIRSLAFKSFVRSFSTCKQKKAFLSPPPPPRATLTLMKTCLRDVQCNLQYVQMRATYKKHIESKKIRIHRYNVPTVTGSACTAHTKI